MNSKKNIRGTAEKNVHKSKTIGMTWLADINKTIYAIVIIGIIHGVRLQMLSARF